MFRRIIGLVATVTGVFVAFLVGLWALLCLVFVAAGAAIVYAFRSRSRERPRRRNARRHVIEGEFSVVEEKKSGAESRDKDGRSGPSSGS